MFTLSKKGNCKEFDSTYEFVRNIMSQNTLKTLAYAENEGEEVSEMIIEERSNNFETASEFAMMIARKLKVKKWDLTDLDIRTNRKKIFANVFTFTLDGMI